MMPVAFIKRIGIKLVINPKLCQQLGVFSKTDNVEINDRFLQFFRKKYNIWYYAFNDRNKFSEPLQLRKNFLIYPGKYETIRQKYSPKRKRKLRLDEEVSTHSKIMETKIKDAETFISANFIGAKDNNDKAHFLEIFTNLENSGHLKIVAFVYKEKIINTIAVFFDEKTVALLGTFNDKEYVKLSGASTIIDHVIAQNIAQKIFDFEGSEIPAIEEFFRGFRPELKMYPAIANSKRCHQKHFKTVLI
ncbi:hypothetical protein [Chryseobacterium wanjuense]